jgi:hypothetical protein
LRNVDSSGIISLVVVAKNSFKPGLFNFFKGIFAATNASHNFKQNSDLDGPDFLLASLTKVFNSGCTSLLFKFFKCLPLLKCCVT